MKFVNTHITEKTVGLARKHQFCLEVSSDLNRYEIRKLVKALFNKEPEKILIIKGKSRKEMTARKKMRTDRAIKKAIVVLKKGEILGGFETYLEDKKESKDRKENKKEKEEVKSDGKN
jgi:ribosomal protein L23